MLMNVRIAFQRRKINYGLAEGCMKLNPIDGNSKWTFFNSISSLLNCL